MLAVMKSLNPLIYGLWIGALTYLVAAEPDRPMLWALLAYGITYLATGAYNGITDTLTTNPPHPTTRHHTGE